MKAKLSATVEKPLLKFLDSLPGKTRSEKLERLLLAFKEIREERELRRALTGYREDTYEQAEREAWERTVAEAMWNE